MNVVGVFQVYKCNANSACQIIDGRVLTDICITDKLFVIKNKDITDYIYNNAMQECIEVSDNAHFDFVNLKSIFSYGEYWETLNGGMSARIECFCNITIEDNDVICKLQV